MNNEKRHPVCMEIQIFVDEKQVIKFAWPNIVVRFASSSKSFWLHRTLVHMQLLLSLDLLPLINMYRGKYTTGRLSTAVPLESIINMVLM